MKPIRQLYLGLFLVSCISLAFLLFPQHINALKIPNFFGVLAAGMMVSVIRQIIRSRKEGAAFSLLIPAIAVLLVFCSHIAALFVISTPITGGSAAFLFYLITALVNMALSAVGFFLK